jgi:hypothetical protein
VSLHNVETPTGGARRHEKQPEKPPTLENDTNASKNCSLHTIFQQPASLEGKQQSVADISVTVSSNEAQQILT